MTIPTTSRLSSRRNGHLVVPAYVRFDDEFHARATSDVTPGMVLWVAFGVVAVCWLLWQAVHGIGRLLGIGG